MSAIAALGSGLAGACALTLLHETTRRVVPHAPRMDVLGMRAIAGGMRQVGQEPPDGNTLHKVAFAGDLASNTLYYSLIGLVKPADALACGAMLGLTAGIGAVALPGPLGLGTAPSARTAATQWMTVGLYLAGGIATALAYRCCGTTD